MQVLACACSAARSPPQAQAGPRPRLSASFDPGFHPGCWPTLHNSDHTRNHTHHAHTMRNHAHHRTAQGTGERHTQPTLRPSAPVNRARTKAEHAAVQRPVSAHSRQSPAARRSVPFGNDEVLARAARLARVVLGNGLQLDGEVPRGWWRHGKIGHRCHHLRCVILSISSAQS